MTCSDGVVLAVENIVTSKLYEPLSNKRVYNLDQHIGVAVAGLLADAKALVEWGRQEAAKYRRNYGEPMPGRLLTEYMSEYMHAYTLYSGARPFGVSLLLASFDEQKPHLFCIEPSGVSYEYHGYAVGKAKQTAKTEIEKLKLAQLDMKTASREAARIIYLVHDDVKDKAFELEMSWVGAASEGRHQTVPAEQFALAEAAAKQALEEAEDSDEEL